MNAAAARRWYPRVALAVLMAVAGFGLAACESATSLFNFSSPATPEVAVSTPPPSQPPLAKVAVAPVIGAPDAIAKQIQQEFTGAIEKQRVSVTANKEDRADYTLRGYIVAAKDKSATKVSYIWDVTDPSGKRVNRITGEELVAANAANASSKDPWAAVTPQVAQAIASKAANSFVAWLPSQSGQPAVAAVGQPAAVGAHPSAPPSSATKRAPVMAIVPSVTGAPGDGIKSLTAAIQRELTGKGVSISDKPTAVAYRVEGSVTMGAAAQGKQSIHIEWLVRDPQGKKLGTVSQRNEIPEGSLDGEWGKTADQAAGAAAQGILKLLPQQKAIN
jgi:hypothetical protein